MITQFLGTAPNTPATPPLDVNDGSLSVTTTTTGESGTAGSSTTTTTVPTTTIAPFDPTPC